MGNYFGYERISTKEERGMQHFSRQDAALKKYAAKHKIDYVRIYGDDSSGKDFIRREWIQLEKALHEGDTIVFKDLSRFTRQAEEPWSLSIIRLYAVTTLQSLLTQLISRILLQEQRWKGS